MNYSQTMSGILVAVGGIILTQFGLSDNCSNEVVAKLTPVLGAIPGLALAWLGRVRAGGVTLGGFKKA